MCRGIRNLVTILSKIKLLTWTSSFLSSSIKTAMGYKESSPAESLAAIVEPSPVLIADIVVFIYFFKSPFEP